MDAYLEESLLPREERSSVAREVSLTAADGFRLAATLYSPRERGAAARLVIVNSAMAVPRKYYGAFSRFLAAAGLDVLTYDYRGIGGSRPVPVGELRARLRDWGEKDFAAALAWGERELGVRAPLVVGHSVGGQILGLADDNARIGRVLLVGAQMGDWRLWPRAARPRAVAFWYGIVPPITNVLGYLPGGVLGGEAVPGGVVREWARWARRPGYMVGGADGARAAGYARVTAPILAYSFSDDGFAPQRAVGALLDLYKGADKTHRHVAPSQLGLGAIGHFGFFREALRDRLWAHALDWLAGPRATPS